MRQLVITTFIPILICINSVNAQNIIRIHEKSNDKIAYSQIFQSAKLVKLETSPECLIGGIGTLKVDGDHLFAYDNRQETLFVFTLKLFKPAKENVSLQISYFFESKLEVNRWKSKVSNPL